MFYLIYMGNHLFVRKDSAFVESCSINFEKGLPTKEGYHKNSAQQILQFIQVFPDLFFSNLIFVNPIHGVNHC